jgi:uncharacterized protein YjbI with pentapeptide repeats
VTIGSLAWVLGPGAGWILQYVDDVHGLRGKDLADALDAVRGRALAVGTVLGAVVAVYYTARNADTARRTFQLGEQGHVTERYTKAIDQLGSEKLEIRLGGIYALERIAADSIRDHAVVYDVLAAFVREHLARRNRNSRPSTGVDDARIATDIRAAVTVIGRRRVECDNHPPSLAGVDLTGVDLTGERLAHVVLSNAVLKDAGLSRVNLSGSDLSDADLSDANLMGANLSNATLKNARLSGAILRLADLSDADLTFADLYGADLELAYLSRADLSTANLKGASFGGGGRYTTTSKGVLKRIVDAE